MVEIEASERISRFVLQSNRINKSTGQVKADAFLPNTKLVPPQTSVCCSSTYEDEQLWNVAEVHLGASRAKATGKKTLYGCANVLAGEITKHGLTINRDDAPFNGHSNILGWPSSKDQQREVALLIAEASKFKPLKDGELPKPD